MQNYIKYEPIANFPNIVANVRRYEPLRFQGALWSS